LKRGENGDGLIPKMKVQHSFAASVTVLQSVRRNTPDYWNIQ